MYAAQNVGQVIWGLNLKCASCHDSFINDCKLKKPNGFEKKLQTPYRKKADANSRQGKWLKPKSFGKNCKTSTTLLPTLTSFDN